MANDQRDRPAGAAALKLLDVVRARIRARHYNPTTERAYVGWIRRFILFHVKRHPREMAETAAAGCRVR